MLAAFFIGCLVLGGGTREGFLSDVLLQATAIPLLLWILWRFLDIPTPLARSRARAALLVCSAVAALPIIQLVPLPPDLWKMLPGRIGYEANLKAAGLEPSWLPISVSPRATWLSFLALLPPAVMFLGTLQLDYRERRWMSAVLLVVGLTSILLGLLQVTQGPSSPLRFFTITNPHEAVGFFANRNHFAALLYCLLLVAAAWTIAAVGELVRSRRRLRSTATTAGLIKIVLCSVAIVVVVGAQVMTKSRAGLGLTMLVLMVIVAIAYIGPDDAFCGAARRPRTSRAAMRILASVASIGLMIGLQFGLYGILERFDVDPLTDARIYFARNTINAALAYMPTGSGVGTFVPVYGAFEKISDNTAAFYVNRAHNDFLEFWLEAGAVGLIAIALFIGWVVSRSAAIWRRGMAGAKRIDVLLACGATLMLALLTVHSVVDYPLRTTALMSVFAFANALLIVPVGSSSSSSTATARSAISHMHGWFATGARTVGHTGTAAEPQSMSARLTNDRCRNRFVPITQRKHWPDEWRRTAETEADSYSG